MGFGVPKVQEAAVNTGVAQFVPRTAEPSEHDAGMSFTSATAALPPWFATNETLDGESTAGARAVVPGVTTKVTVVILPVASAMVNGTVKPPQPSATELDVKRKMPP